LFERNALERRQRKLDLPDAITAAAFSDLLQRYRFTTQDSADAALSRTIDAGVDPEMLGRVFEELMAEAQRGDTGTFFTPPAVVDRLVGYALQALERADLRDLRVLDPACGSGAFLLGALGRIAELRAQREGGSPDQYKRDLVERALHGVDLQDDAALLCALRLWLCLLPARPEPDAVQPLPNLDRRIRQGDALTDPLDLANPSSVQSDVSRSVASSTAVRTILKTLRPLAHQYVTAEPHDKEPLRRQLRLLETQLARAWLATARQKLSHAEAEQRAQLGEVDLFGVATTRAQAATGALERIAQQQSQLDPLSRQLAQRKAVPFFSFDVHFADSAPHGFDLIVSNPPWVRAHRWPGALGQAIRQRYEVCRSAGWKAADVENRLPGAQVDLSLLFSKATRLLAPRGALALLLPAKTFRSLYAGGARALLLRDTRIAWLEDYSLDQRAIFRADAFTAAVVAVKDAPSEAPVRVVCHQRHGPPLDFELCPRELPLVPGEDAAPWLLVPPEVGSAIRQMQSCGPTIGQRADLPVHRGVFTGANEVLLIDAVEPKLGDLAWIRAAGFSRTPAGVARSRFRSLIEDGALRPVVRGASIGAWRFDPEGWLIWAHDTAGKSVRLPKRAQRYVERHAERLAARRAWQIGQSLGRVFSVGPHTTRPKVAWRDIAPTLQATLLPSTIRSIGRTRELIPLNTVYYITPHVERTALVLCAYFNSLPVRAFARALAERAKDAHFRFFAWTIRQVPLPDGWDEGGVAARLHELARAASNARECIAEVQQELDALIASAYRLNAQHIDALTRYQAWLDQAQMTGPRTRE
jgi:methylase of polypeptide subunit release factors